MNTKGLFIELKYNRDGMGLEGINFLEDKGDAGSKYMLCGGVLNRKGGKLLFKARTIEEANEFTKRNPLTSKIITLN